MLNVMNKFLALGLSVDEVILRSTWNPAREIGQQQLGNLSVGSPADVAVLRLEQGEFGFLDAYGARLRGNRKLTCEMTLRDGKIVYELNGLSRPDWTTLPKGYRSTRRPSLGRQPQLQRRPDADAARCAGSEDGAGNAMTRRWSGGPGDDHARRTCRGRDARMSQRFHSQHDRRRLTMSRLETKRRTFLTALAAVPGMQPPGRRSPGRRPGNARGARRDRGAGRPVVHQRGRHVHGADRLPDAARGGGGDAGRLAQVRPPRRPA